MGLGLRWREKVRQVGKKSAQPDKNGFVPTNYERVQLTHEEAVAFADSLKTIRKRISEAHLARTRMLRDIERTLTGSLPRVHEIDPVTGEHSTTEAAPEEHEVGGDYVHNGTLTRLADENDIKVQQQVYDPIDKWISEVDLFKGKMKILENLRLELDGSRRDHINIENKIAKQEAKQNEVDSKHTTHIQSKDASIAGKRTAYEQYEAQVYEELVNLVGESGVLHTALDRAMKLEIEIYQRARDPIASTTARLENLSSASGLNSPASSTQYTPAGTGVGSTFAPSTGAGYAGSTGSGPTTHTNLPYSAQTVAYPSAPTTSIPGTGNVNVNYAGGSAVPQTSGGTSSLAPGAGGSTVAYERPYAA